MFEAKTKAEWLAQVRKELKGQDLEGLNWELEGLTFTPFYHTEDALNAEPIRQGQENNAWEIGERIIVADDYAAANRLAIDALMKGANALYFVFAQQPQRNDLAVLFQNIHLEWISTHFETSAGRALATDFLAIIAEKGENAAAVACSFRGANDDFLQDAPALNDLATLLPKAKFFTIDTSKDTSVVGSLAAALQQGNDLLTALNAELDLHTAQNWLQFSITLNDAYFPSVAKIRALKLLWQQILTAWDDKLTATPNIEVQLTDATQSTDEHYNKIRATTQAMSAVIGGAARLFVYPSDAFQTPQGTTFSRRIALNVQHLLQQEAYLDRVIDPAAGSYFVEQLTEKIAEAAWEMFRK
jgi:methylmalonyl-CoA mutase